MPESSSYDTASSDKPRSCGGLEKTSTKLSIVVTCAPTTLPLMSCLFGSSSAVGTGGVLTLEPSALISPGCGCSERSLRRTTSPDGSESGEVPNCA